MAVGWRMLMVWPLRAFRVVRFCAAAQAELSHFTHPTGALRL